MTLRAVASNERSLGELLTPVELAGLVKIEVGTLARWRYLGRGPAFLKLGGVVRYRRSDVAEWMQKM